VIKTLEPTLCTFSDEEATPDASDAEAAFATLRVRCIKLAVIHFRGPQQRHSRKDANATGRLQRPVALIRHVIPSEVNSEGNNILGTWTFLAFAHFEFYFLTFRERCMPPTTLDFRMMNEKIFSSILRCNKTKTFSVIEPLDCTLTHSSLFCFVVN
jgi:hypothetical protein